MKKTTLFLTVLIAFVFIGKSQNDKGLEDGLVAHYLFNGNANDESGNGNHGTVNGALLVNDRFGNFNSAYVFDGNDDSIEILDDPSLDITNSISLSVWFNFNSDPYGLTEERAYLIDKMWAWRIWYSPNGHGYSEEDQFLFDIWDWDGVGTQSIIWNTNEWYNLICTYDGNIAKVYVNGVLNNQENVIKTLHTSSTNLFIGEGISDGYVHDFHNGSLDDIRIYNRALTEEEIVSLYYINLFSLNLKLILEGPYSGTEMNTNLNPNPIPFSQPYNNPQKWNYQGTESVVGIPNSDIVDWVLIELRETSGDASTAIADSMIARKAAFLLKDGSIVDLDGESPLYFDNEISDFLYVVVYHRNHLPVMSSSPLTIINAGYSFDFTTPEGQAFGTDAQKNLGTVYGMIGGDSDANGIIDMNDKDLDWTIEAGNKGYYPSDLNMDTEVNNPDKNDFWETNLGYESQLPIPIIFICGGQINDFDGNTYNTVQIGDQCWMAENLKTTTYQNGSPIPNVTGGSAWSSLTTGAYAWYNNDIGWKDHYGALYNWYAIIDANGLCPTGWHVPTNDEWAALTNFIGGTASPHGNELKSCRQENTPLGGDCNTTEHPRWNQDSYNWGTDDFGFSGLPGGYLSYYDGSFGTIGVYGWWWSSTTFGSYHAWFRNLHNSSDYVYASGNNKPYGLSVRCLRD
jgi:uncharacterized protein (TIGR02145 family)